MNPSPPKPNGTSGDPRREAWGAQGLRLALVGIVIYLGWFDFQLHLDQRGEPLVVVNRLLWGSLWALGLVSGLVLVYGRHGLAGFTHRGERFALAALATFPLTHVFIETTVYPGARLFATWLLVTLLLTAVLGSHRKRSLEAERLRQLAELNQERALRARLAPHFLFNTLNTLQAQIALDPVAARASTFKLAKLYRQLLQVQDRARIPLREELDFVLAYLDLEQLRFGDRLEVVQELPEGVLDLPLPPLALQILVENALKHGVAPLEEGGRVRIGADGLGDQVHLWVEDPGPGLGHETGSGTALATLRGQLHPGESLDLAFHSGVHRATLVLQGSKDTAS